MSTTALVPIAQVEQTDVGLKFPEHMEFDDWKDVGIELCRVHTKVSWAIADWLFYGEWEYGRTYEEALDVTGLSYQALADLKYVAGRFDHGRRVKELSVGHHREVAALPLGEADNWLKAAKKQGWSSKALREQVATARADRVVSPEAHGGVNELVTLKLAPERVARWRAAALHAKLELEDWIVASCDAASK